MRDYGYGLRLKFQPIYEPRKNRLFGYECLLNIADSAMGVLQPAVFMPVAKKYPAFMRKLDEWTIRSVFAINAEFASENATPPLLTINVDHASFHDTHGFLDSVSELMQEFEVSPEHIGFEVSEQSLSAEGEDATLSLRSEGFKIIVDGVAPNALNHKLLVADMIKLARPIVTAATADESKRTEAKRVVDYAHTADIPVCALGIENPEAEALFLSFGCEYMQGYYYSKPLEISHAFKEV